MVKKSLRQFTLMATATVTLLLGMNKIRNIQTPQFIARFD